MLLFWTRVPVAFVVGRELEFKAISTIETGEVRFFELLDHGDTAREQPP